MRNKKIIISGVTGQDGSYMAEYLLENTDHTIIGGIRRTSQAILSNIKHLLDNPRFKLHTLDLCDVHSVTALIREEKPDYFINFGAATFVADSWNQPALHFRTNAESLIHILEAIRIYNKDCILYSSGSSEQMGDVKYSPQDEKHPMSPRSIYGVSKCAASHICKVYRESFGLNVVHGILYNHESPRRQDYFVTRKITLGVAQINKAMKNEVNFSPIKLGNIYAKRDWSHAKDFVDGIWKMLNQDGKSKEYILASGEEHSIKEFVELAFLYAGFQDCYWVGEGLNEEFVLPNYICEEYNVAPTLVEIDPAFFRPADVESLCGDSSLARKELGWQPKYSFNDLVKEMVESDISLCKIQE